MKIKFISFLLIIVLLSCSRENPGDKSENRQFSPDRKINVVTTTGMIADLVRNIGGERVEVTALMGPGIDPHLYKASAGDVSRMRNADIIFYNGLHLEGKMVDVFEKMASKKPVYAVASGIPEEKLLSPPEFSGAHDPHIWFDVSLWIEAGQFVQQIFMEKDVKNKFIYKQNGDLYLNILNELHLSVKTKSETVHEEKRVLITAHDAFNYFGRAYGFQVKGLQGISTASEAGAGDVQDLADFIALKKIPAVFVESSVPQRYIKALQAAVESRDYKTIIGGSLYSDAMGNPDSKEGTYTGMVEHNINTIVNALGE